MKNVFKVGCLLFVSFSSLSGVAILPTWAADKLVPSIISFGGTGPVYYSPTGSTREEEARVGLSIPYGTVVRTTAANTVTIEYPDGSLVAIDSNTKMEIQERKAGVQSNTLHGGQLRGSIAKIKDSDAPKKPRFLIRSKAAVMGVRGTEFVMAVEPNGFATQIHTLEGIVDVAADESSLMSGASNVQSVASGNFVEASSTGLSSPKPFNVDQFINTLKAPPAPNAAPGVAFTNEAGQTFIKQALPKVDFKGNVASFFGSGKKDDRYDPEKENRVDKDLAKKEDEQQKPEEKKPEDQSRKVKLMSFDLGVFFVNSFYWEDKDGPQECGGPCPPKASYGNYEMIRSAHAAWNPTFPIPIFKFLYAKGHLGVNFAQNGSLFERFWVTEYQVYLQARLFEKFFAEIGGGGQSWFNRQDRDLTEGLLTMNVGLLFNDGGLMDRVFLGRSEVKTWPRPIEEFHAGIGISF